MAIVVNKPLPEFEANATGGIKVSNTSHLGQVVVLYFYPKDNTPGCTTEAMQFRDKYKDFAKIGAAVFGVSRDNMKSHDEFKEKLELPFELIADTEEKMCHMIGVVKAVLRSACLATSSIAAVKSSPITSPRSPSIRLSSRVIFPVPQHASSQRSAPVGAATSNVRARQALSRLKLKIVFIKSYLPAMREKIP